MVKAPNYSGTNATYQAFTVADAAETDKARGPMKKSAGGGFTGARRLALIQVIEGEIIPRLLLTHSADAHAHTQLLCPASLRWTEDPQTLAAWFLRTSEEDILASLQLLSESEQGREGVYYRILAAVPAALETLWERGECTLDAMTHGLALLDHVLEELHRRERGNTSSPGLDS